MYLHAIISHIRWFIQRSRNRKLCAFGSILTYLCHPQQLNRQQRLPTRTQLHGYHWCHQMIHPTNTIQICKSTHIHKPKGKKKKASKHKQQAKGNCVLRICIRCQYWVCKHTKPKMHLKHETLPVCLWRPPPSCSTNPTLTGLAYVSMYMETYQKNAITYANNMGS